MFPNLEWLPSTSVERRPEHVAFYGLVLPIRHPFWRENFPGNLWGCRCDVEATDAERTPDADIPGSWTTDRPDKGLDVNPAHAGEVFSRSHPYYTEAFAGAGDAVRALIDQIYPDYADVKVEPYHAADFGARRKELRKLAKSLKSKPFRNEEFGRNIFLSKDGINEYLNQPHEYYVHKNELLLKMPEVMRKAEYLGVKGSFKEKHGSTRSHIFEIRILGDKSWLIVHETENGEMLFYGISDSSRILEGIKK